jgi:Glyoxalase/Bleomycin resistance protein/Dioxygenase superfamily
MASLTLRGLVPMAHVQDVTRSIDFYYQLGFQTRNTLTSNGQVVWAWVENGKAHLMLTRGARPRNPDAQDVLFYLYSSDVVAYRQLLRSHGVKVSEISYPVYMPEANSASTIPMATAFW